MFAFSCKGQFLFELETLCLLLLVDHSAELLVDQSELTFLLILNAILNDSGEVMEKSECSDACRPIPVAVSVLIQLLGIFIAMLRRGFQILHRFVEVFLGILTEQINLAELEFSIVQP